MPNIGVPEILLVLVIFLVFFGASKIPQAGAALGQGIKNFKKSMNGDDDIDVTPSKKKKKRDAIAAGDDDDEEDEAPAKAESKS